MTHPLHRGLTWGAALWLLSDSWAAAQKPQSAARAGRGDEHRLAARLKRREQIGQDILNRKHAPCLTFRAVPVSPHWRGGIAPV